MVAKDQSAAISAIVVELVARVKARSGNVTVVYPAGRSRRQKPLSPVQFGRERLAANR
jgi:hypothetical protein